MHIEIKKFSYKMEIGLSDYEIKFYSQMIEIEEVFYSLF